MKNVMMPVSIAFAAGAALGAKLGSVILPAAFWLAASLILVLAFMRAGRKSRLGDIALLAVVLVSGFVNYEARNTFPPEHIKFLAGPRAQEHILLGEIASNPVFKKTASYYPELEFLLSAHEISSGSERVKTSGLVQVRAKYEKGLSFEYGQEVSLQAALKSTSAIEPRDGFDYGKYLENKRIYATARVKSDADIKALSSRNDAAARTARALYRLKNAAKREILVQLPHPHAGIVIAMVAGDREFLDKATRAYFVDTGTMHIIAISGLHMALLAIIFIGFFRLLKCPLKPAYFLAAVSLVLYSVMVGDAASVWRSTVMAVIFMAGFVIDRRASIKNSFGVSLVVLLMFDPNYISDVGFLLSYICVAALIWVHPVVMNIIIPDSVAVKAADKNKNNRREALKKHLAEPLVLSVSVWITVLPVIAHYFKTVTPAIVLANLFAVPLSFLMIILGVAGLSAGLVMPILARLIFESLDFVCAALVWLTKMFAALPLAHFDVADWSGFAVAVYYVFLTGAFIYFPRRQSARRKGGGGGER